MTDSQQVTEDTRAAAEMPDQCMTIAIVSDLHAYENEEPDHAPSHYCIRDPGNDSTKNPIAAFQQLVSNESLSADLLLCPGDLADKANPPAIRQAWLDVNKMQGWLGADLLVATAGNHDVDSRHEHNSFDAKGALQALCPPFPFQDENLNDRYWARHFVTIRTGCLRLLVLNSSAFHGEPCSAFRGRSGEDFFYHAAFLNAGKALVQPLIGETESLVVDS